MLNEIHITMDILILCQKWCEYSERVFKQIADAISKMDESKQKRFIELFEAENKK